MQEPEVMKHCCTPEKCLYRTIAILLVLFTVLKLTGAITWSWLWVLSPFWVPWCLGVLLAVLLAVLPPRAS